MTTGDTQFQATWQPRFLGLLRLVFGFLFVAHGTQKILGFPPPAKPMVLQLDTLAGWSGILELIGGLLILVGLLTRPVAFVLSGMMAVAYFTVHAKMGLWPILNKGELSAIYSFLFLYFAVAGAGAFSIDSFFRKYKVVPADEAEAPAKAPATVLH